MYVADQTVIPRLSLVWDNTQKLVQTRSYSHSSKNESLLWANVYTQPETVCCDTVTSRSTLKALDIPVTAFLPSAYDYDCLKERMLAVDSRILAHHVQFFHQHSVVTYHIKHKYSAESAVKSELVCNCGVIVQRISDTIVMKKKCSERRKHCPTSSPVSTGMGDCLQAGKLSHLCNQPPRPTQPFILSG